jgi:hypothetical protein
MLKAATFSHMLKLFRIYLVMTYIFVKQDVRLWIAFSGFD